MINRSAFKYRLKKLLPRFIFTSIFFLWKHFIRHIVALIDKVRLLSFTTTKIVRLTHLDKTFSLTISPENGFIDKHIFLYGVYEPFILDLISQYLEAGMTFVDIGANIGQHSMYAARTVGATGAVYAYEPIPKIYNQLLTSVKVNNFNTIIHAKNIALGKVTAKETLHVSKNIGGSSLVNEEENKDQRQEDITVQICNGDEELRMLPRINLIKIDVEGYEYEVLTGILETLKKHRPTLLLEFSGQFYAQHTDHHGIKILSLLHNIGYHLYDVEDEMKKITNIISFDILIATKRAQTNLVCRFIQ